MTATFNHLIIPTDDAELSAACYRRRSLPDRVHVEGEGRAVYVLDPAGHPVELLTRPYV